MVFPNNNYNIMNNNRIMVFYDEGEEKSIKPNPKPVIYQCDRFQYIDRLNLIPFHDPSRITLPHPIYAYCFT